MKSERAKKKFDPDNRRNSSRGGYEGWDMDVRQFMLNRNNREKYDFLVISADGAFLDNKFNADNALERMKVQTDEFQIPDDLDAHPSGCTADTATARHNCSRSELD